MLKAIDRELNEQRKQLTLNITNATNKKKGRGKCKAKCRCAALEHTKRNALMNDMLWQHSLISCSKSSRTAETSSAYTFTRFCQASSGPWRVVSVLMGYLINYPYNIKLWVYVRVQATMFGPSVLDFLFSDGPRAGGGFYCCCYCRNNPHRLFSTKIFQIRRC